MTASATSRGVVGAAVPPRWLREVPWAFVLGSTVLLALAGGFVATAVRGVVGSFERALDPVTAWLLMSGLAAPPVLLGTLGALALIRSRWSLARTRGAFLLASLTVAVGLVVGSGLLVTDGIADHAVQSDRLRASGGMSGMTDPAMVTTMVADNAALHVRAVGLGMLVLLATDLLVVGWVLALHGGRLGVARPRR